MKFDDILKRTLNKVNESYDIRTGIGSDVRNVDYGKYVVIFSDGDQIEVEADSKFDAKNKALKQNPGKTPTNVKKVEEGKLSDFNKDDEKTQEKKLLEDESEYKIVYIDSQGNQKEKVYDDLNSAQHGFNRMAELKTPAKLYKGDELLKSCEYNAPTDRCVVVDEAKTNMYKYEIVVTFDLSCGKKYTWDQMNKIVKKTINSISSFVDCPTITDYNMMCIEPGDKDKVVDEATLDRKYERMIKRVIKGWMDNYGEEKLINNVEALDMLSNIMSDGGWGHKIKDEFFNGPDEFREELENRLLAKLREENLLENPEMVTRKDVEEAIGDPGEILAIKKQLDGMFVLLDYYGHRFCAYKTPEEAELWAKENGYKTSR